MAANYTNISNIKQYWLETIAPNYFDFDNVNTYQGGMFGYINEIMGNSVEDTAVSVNIARREFYPNTAEYESSLYKMAALQRMDAPLATPATANALLLLNMNDILNNATFENGMYAFVLDNTMTIMAGDIPFILEYPIVILGKKKTSSGEYSFVSHYDISLSNDLSTSSDKYINNVVITGNGVKYLLLSVNIRQASLQSIPKIIQKDVTLSTITEDFTYDGILANFEVFYKESDTAEEIQLKKVLKNGTALNVPFVYYELINSDTIRLTIKKNPYFIPAFNATLRVEIYTTMGTDGEFPVCLSDLSCIMNSTKYSYNNNMMITGKINGSSSGATNKPSKESFATTVQNRYSTNNTLVTVSDVQAYFNSAKDQLGDDGITHSKMTFKKLRDDIMYRIFGSYALLKDTTGNVIPTNTVEIKTLVTLEGAETMYYIKPGQIFQYSDMLNASELDTSNKICDINKTMKITDTLDDSTETNGNLFTSPYLVSVNIPQSLVGFYLNSISTKKSLLYSYVNDESYMQFIAFSANIIRNAMLGKNYYTISVYVKPASALEVEKVCTMPDLTDETNIIRAKQNGIVESITMTSSGRVVAAAKYEDGTEETIAINSYTDATKDFIMDDGYDFNYDVGDSFIAGNILATKKPHDLGTITVICDFVGLLLANSHYIPMYVEGYDVETESYLLQGYIATDDTITTEGNINITTGIYTAAGRLNDNVIVPYRGLKLNFHIFYKDADRNVGHNLGAITAVKDKTLVATCMIDVVSEGYFDLIQQIDYVRSVVDYLPYGDASDPDTFYITINEVPMISAKWAKISSNYIFFVEKLVKMYKILQNIYLLLKNQYGLDMKFFNTYGRAKYFQVGINKERVILDTVNTSLRFGVYLNSVSHSDAVLNEIKAYIKNYIESINYSSTKGQSIYILTLCADCKNEFDEIEYMEWYGINGFDYGVQTIESLSDFDIAENKIINYIPEFININSIQAGDGIMVPDISLTLLNENLNNS